MGSFKLTMAIILYLLAIWVRGIHASNVLLANLKSFTAGGVGGVFSVLAGHPLDLVKVRMQTQQTDKNAKSEGTFGILRQIIQQEGFWGMYRGVSAPIVAVAPIWATSFWGFDVGMKFVRLAFKLDPAATLTLPQLCIAGGFSAFPTALVMVPSERIKCILQMQRSDGGTAKYLGTRDCAKQLYQESGIAGLYKGTVLTLMRDIPANIAYFGIYEITKQSMMNKAGVTTPSTLTALTAGAMAGVAFWPIALPTDTLKSRYQTAEEGHYKNISDVYTEVIEEDGVGGLFKGMGPAMIRSAPANAISFLGAEVTKKVLSAFVP